MSSRRGFLETVLQSSALVALAPTVPAFLAATARAAAPERDGRVLVVIQLDGGNDGINTVVPYKDEGYARHRTVLRLAAEGLLKIDDSVGLHPSLAGAAKLLERGELAIVQGVGYPNPSRSHFRSMAVWHSARTDPEDHGGAGWLGRVGDDRLAARAAWSTCYVGEGEAPPALLGRRSVPTSLGRVEDFVLNGAPEARRLLESDGAADDLAAFVRRSTLDAYAAADRIAELVRPDRSSEAGSSSALGQRLATIVRLMKSGMGARVYYTRHGNFDTHADQLNTHARLLQELSSALVWFQDELAASGLAYRVVVLCVSEFGRRVAENDSKGTDHGTAGPVFLVGKSINGGLTGPTPSLMDLEEGDLKMSVDFRRIYAAVLRDWLVLPASSALGGQFEPLPLFRAT
jgi:uncharacterized protein (DUF1501 family)